MDLKIPLSIKKNLVINIKIDRVGQPAYEQDFYDIDFGQIEPTK